MLKICQSAMAALNAVLMHFGLLHFPDPDKALAAAYRVLKSGGRLAFTSWALW